MGGARIFCLKLAKKMVLEDDARLVFSPTGFHGTSSFRDNVYS
jgi:hypothetical protein